MKNRSSKDPESIGRKPFPRTARLLKPYEFKRVFKTSTASSDRFFKILARPNGGSLSRLGLAVSRKVDKLAVGRNRIKRVVRESFRQWFDTDPRWPGPAQSEPGMDLVVLPRPLCASICNKQLNASLEAHWARLKKSIGQSGPHTG